MSVTRTRPTMGAAVAVATCRTLLKQSCFQLTSSEENHIVHLLKALIPSIFFFPPPPRYFVVDFGEKAVGGHSRLSQPHLVAGTAFPGIWERKKPPNSKVNSKVQLFPKGKQCLHGGGLKMPCICCCRLLPSPSGHAGRAPCHQVALRNSGKTPNVHKPEQNPLV